MIFFVFFPILWINPMNWEENKKIDSLYVVKSTRVFNNKQSRSRFTLGLNLFFYYFNKKKLWGVNGRRKLRMGKISIVALSLLLSQKSCRNFIIKLIFCCFYFRVACRRFVNFKWKVLINFGVVCRLLNPPADWKFVVHLLTYSKSREIENLNDCLKIYKVF